jgi:hypothetical protein
MQEKAQLLNVCDITSITTSSNNSERESNHKLLRSHQATNNLRQRKFSLVADMMDPSQFSLSDKRIKSLYNEKQKILERESSNESEQTEFTPKLIPEHLSLKLRSKYSFDSKHDSRLVNEVFQVFLRKIIFIIYVRFVKNSFFSKNTVAILENEFDTKIQAEMLVLVDVLHSPRLVFPINSTLRTDSLDKNFITK